MEKLLWVDFDEVYTLFQKAFIPEELRPYDKMKQLFQNNDFIIYGYKENQRIIAALIIWELESCVYLENFAVDESMRGQGLGGRILKDVQNIYQDQFLILEVEKPFDEMSQRRIGFYQRHQFLLNTFSYVQPTLDVLPTNVHLQLMSYPHHINDKQFQTMKDEIFNVVYHVI